MEAQSQTEPQRDPNGLPATPVSDDLIAGKLAAEVEAPEQPHAQLGRAPYLPPALATPLTNALAAMGLPKTLDSLNKTLHGIDHELELLSRTHKYDWISKRLLVLRNVIIASALVVITVLVVVITYRELNKEVLVIGGFDVPAMIEQRGFSSRVMGKKLFDQLTYIRAQTLSKLPKKDIVPSVWKSEADVAIPETKLTVGALFAYLRGLLGRDTYVDGEMTEQGQLVAVTVRIRGKPHQTVAGSIDELDALMLKAAEHVMLETHPYVLAQFRYFKDDMAGSLQAVLISAQSNNPAEVADALQLWGQLRAAKGDMIGAMAKWEESLLASPQTSRALEGIIQELRKVGHKDEALRRLQQQIASFPNQSFAWAQLAAISFDEGDYAGSEKYNKRALALNPYDAAAMFNETQLLQGRDPAAALAIGERMERAVALTQDPLLRAQALGAQMNALIGMREFDRAKSIAENYIATAPLDSYGYYRLAQALVFMHDYDAALAAADKSIAMGSRSAYLNRVRALIGKGDLSAALYDVEVNLKSYPYYALGFSGLIYLAQKKPADAAKKFRELIALLPKGPYGYTGLGRALAVLGDRAGAEQQFRKAAEVEPMDSAPYLYWGELLATNGDHTGAIQKYKQALVLDQKWGEPYAAWGDALAAMGDASAANENYAKALELEPRNPQFQKYKPRGR